MSTKVIITGAYCTGKTTLFHALDRELRNLGLSVASMPDLARNCPLPLNLEQTDISSIWLATTQIAREVEAEASAGDVVLCDRGIPDIMGHIASAQSAQIGGDLIRSFEPALSEWNRTYDVILYSTLNPRIPIVRDGLRVLDPAYREKLDELTWKCVSGLDKTHKLSGSPEARITASLQAVLRSIESSGAISPSA